MDHVEDPGYSVEQIDGVRALTLRAALFAPVTGTDVADPGDHDRSTTHFGALRRGTLIGVATMASQPLPGHADAGSVRIHGVAVEHGHRGRGVGAMLVEAVVGAASTAGAGIVWASVPASAHGFFAHLGFRRIGDPFEDRDGVPHYRMVAEPSQG